jgi:hypothetical protein
LKQEEAREAAAERDDELSSKQKNQNEKDRNKKPNPPRSPKKK